MFVFDSEKCPHPSACDFREADEEGADAAVLDVGRVDGIEDPVEAQDGVEDHGEVVVVWVFVGADVAEEAFAGVWLEEGPIHEEIPDRAINCIDGGEGREERQHAVVSVDPIQTQGNIVHYRRGIFATIDEMWEDVSRIIVTA